MTRNRAHWVATNGKSAWPLTLAMLGLVLGSCGSLEGLAGACWVGPGESPVPPLSVARTIQLHDRWTGAHGSLCFSEILVSDGRFIIIGHTDGTPSVADPWF